MPKWGYSVQNLDLYSTVKASGREVSVSHKAAREICKTIKGMRLEMAKEFLNQVIMKRRSVPFRRFKKKVPHREDIQSFYAGRYPVKAAKEILKVIEGAEANAEYMGLDTEKLYIIHASAYPGRKRKKYIPRAFGRSTPYFDILCHIEIALGPKEE